MLALGLISKAGVIMSPETSIGSPGSYAHQGRGENFISHS